MRIYPNCPYRRINGSQDERDHFCPCNRPIKTPPALGEAGGASRRFSRHIRGVWCEGGSCITHRAKCQALGGGVAPDCRYMGALQGI